MPAENPGIQSIENGGPTRTVKILRHDSSRLGCADDAIANFPPTLDAGPRRSLRRGPAHGVDLPPTVPAVWRIGGVEKVAWGLAVNHGGGYSFRLCPKTSAGLTEECFQRTPLAFAGNSTVIVGWHGEVLYTIPASRTTVGTTPAGSMWTR